MSDAEKSFQGSEIRSPSRWKKEDVDELSLLHDNDDASIASRETDLAGSDLFKRPRIPRSYDGDTPRSKLEDSFRSNIPESIDEYSLIEHVKGSFRARLDSEKGDTGEFKSTENVYTEFFHDVKLKDEFTWDGIWPLIYTALISIGIEVYREYVNSNFEAAYDVYTIRIVSVFSVLMILVYCAIMFFESYVLMVALSVLVIVNNFCCIQAAVLDIIGFYTSFDEADKESRYQQFLKYYLANILNPPLVLFQMNALRYTFLNIHAWRLGAIKFDKDRRNCKERKNSSSEEESSDENDDSGLLRPTETAL
ncbi:Oidioi.mRNA.OKI2018_I69.PAR.g11958.t1.cds [Oikopleura dioica]|uniref:Oidioi.mRNA.OKI2018_I69.PAR.g11958.t1.cds n=1 Tax=Oikopleura dioica TaxID=34765 RepID=A0ABN7RY63_OIKDI|nr:Oidioi.mRNA.OKI2018_I69.PAR.g11958.t1.cds [Oikopleura dioica]